MRPLRNWRTWRYVGFQTYRTDMHREEKVGTLFIQNDGPYSTRFLLYIVGEKTPREYHSSISTVIEAQEAAIEWAEDILLTDLERLCLAASK